MRTNDTSRPESISNQNDSSLACKVSDGASRAFSDQATKLMLNGESPKLDSPKLNQNSDRLKALLGGLSAAPIVDVNLAELPRNYPLEVKLGDSYNKDRSGSPVDTQRYFDAFRRNSDVGYPDDHESVENKKAFENSLPALKAAGGTAIAFELLPQDMQGTLNDLSRRSKDQAISGKLDPNIAVDLAKVQTAFNGAFGDPNGHDKNAAALTEIVATAAKNGFDLIALEPKIDNEYRDGFGYNALRSALKAVPENVAHAFADYLDNKSPLDLQAKAFGEIRAALDNNKSWDGNMDELAKTMRAIKGNDPPLNVKEFRTAIDSYRLGYTDPMKNVIQNFRNETFAKVIADYKSREHTKPPHVAVFAGYGHIFPMPGAKSLGGYMQLEPIVRPGIEPK